ncbi:MAG: DegT/DnrJ/EryC1/StrS family aminotransferase [Acidimicrobiia bacterium]|nr:DegT/DnrJ/EryC1/StrS family aminotransferase [Acidimicrobiia bacterium]
MKIPFLDLGPQWAEIREEAEPLLGGMFAAGRFIGGEQVELFEKEFAAYIGRRFCVALSSGTAAEHFCLRAWGVGPGDEVILPANTFIATSEAVALTGATPVLIDIEPEGVHASVEAAARAITPRTRAIMPVHLFGHCMNLVRWRALADAHGLKLIEDACQAHGSLSGGKRAGTFGHAAAFSFYPGKNLGACGDAGALVTDDEALYDALLMIRNHGASKPFDHQLLGSTERMDAIQAAVLRIKLKRLDDWNDRRRARAAQYVEALAPVEGLWVPRWDDADSPCHHLFVVRHSARDGLARHLAEEGIGTGMHYPVPIHLMPANRWMGLQRGSLPHAEKACETGLSLPMGPHLAAEDCARVAQAVRHFVER